MKSLICVAIIKRLETVCVTAESLAAIGQAGKVELYVAILQSAVSSFK